MRTRAVKHIVVARKAGTAVLVKELEGWRGKASLYRLSPSLEGYEYVIASAVKNDLGAGFMIHETYLFGANEQGICYSYAELTGSIKDTTDHAVALRGANFTVQLVRV